MAYCETARRVCPYLERANEIRDLYTVARATPSSGIVGLRFFTKKMYESRAGALEQKTAELVGDAAASCVDDYCGVLGLAVQSSVMLTAVKELDGDW